VVELLRCRVSESLIPTPLVYDFIYEGLLEHQFRIAPEQYAAVAEDSGQVWKPATKRWSLMR
jgi:hypothetical protein